MIARHFGQFNARLDQISRRFVFAADALMGSFSALIKSAGALIHPLRVLIKASGLLYSAAHELIKIPTFLIDEPRVFSRHVYEGKRRSSYSQ